MNGEKHLWLWKNKLSIINKTVIVARHYNGVLFGKPIAVMIKPPPSLLFCILMDAIGCATYALPGIGEFGDILWAPISAIIFYKTFGGWKGAFGGIFNFIEEILPGTDFIPSFTIMWFWKYWKSPYKTPVAR